MTVDYVAEAFEPETQIARVKCYALKTLETLARGDDAGDDTQGR